MSFFTELKRRNVFRVGIAYLVVTWLIMQVADVVINNIGAPGWVFQVILLILGIGFPVALIFAWAFELTPDGIKKEKDVDRSQSVRKETGRKLNYATIGILALAAGYFFWESRIDQEKGPDTFSQEQTKKITNNDSEKMYPAPFPKPNHQPWVTSYPPYENTGKTNTKRPAADCMHAADSRCKDTLWVMNYPPHGDADELF